MVVGEQDGRPTVAKRKKTGRTRIRRVARVRAFVLAGSLVVGPVPISALRCFSCADCLAGWAFTAHKEDCRPEETFCAAVLRPRADQAGHFSVDRGCASSLSVACPSEETVTTTPANGIVDRERGSSLDDGSWPQCCSSDLCNGSGGARPESYRQSQEHLRNLMEGNPDRKRIRKLSSHRVGGNVGKAVGEGATIRDDDNSAQSARGQSGSRFATVLVIVGTFAQFLWLAGSLLQ